MLTSPAQMKIRTIYFKVDNMTQAVNFWRNLLEIIPHKNSEQWAEFMVGSLRLGLLLNDYGDKVCGSNCVPVWEFSDEELPKYIKKAKELGAAVIEDGLNNPNLKSVVFADPFGNEFELSRFHDDD